MCEVTSGYTKSACVNTGGVDSVIVINLDDISTTTPPTLTPGGQEIDTITLKDGKKGFKYTLDQHSASVTQTPTRSRENNSFFVAQSLMMMLKDDDLATQEAIDPLGRGYFVMIAMQANGKNRTYGLNTGLTLETEENTSGQAYGDMNGSTLNFVGSETKRAPLISTDKVNALLIPAS